ncbi:MAG: hypothetical protein V7609_1927 [Verrucomicrobiota bacterium]
MEGDNASGFGVNLIAYIRAEMGLGTAARGVARALEAAKVPFNILNFEHSNPSLHRDESWRHKEVNFSSYDFTLLAINPDNLANAHERVQRKFVKDRYTIGYWFWELSEIPDQWQASFSLVDEVWAASRFVQEAISRKSPVPVFRVPLPICERHGPQFSRQSFSLPEDQFLFLSMSDAHSHLARKNPLGIVRAFKEAFPGENKGVGLVLKISNGNTPGADHETMQSIREEILGHGNIYLLESYMTREEVDALFTVSDSFVSLHRSEGFGLGPAEAMILGKPVILTNWSGNTDYMTPTNSIGIDYQLVPVGKQLGPYEATQLWADPDLEQAAFWMKRLVDDPRFAGKVGMLGQETIQQEFSPEAAGKIIRGRLKYLHRANLSGGTSQTRLIDPNGVAHLVAFAARGGISDPQQSNAAEVIPGQWCRLKIDLAWGLGDGSVPFRFDPVDRRGIIDLAAVVLRASATGEVLWRANTRGGLDDLAIRGTALRLPHGRLLRFLSYDDDPRIYLPHLTGHVFEEPLTLEVLLRFDPTPQNIERAVSGWNELSVASSGVPLLGEGQPLEPPISVEEPPVSVEPPSAPVPDDQITMVVYSAGESGYAEDRATHVTYARDRWSHLSIALHLGLGSMSLRLDPLTSIGLIDIAALAIKSAINDEVLWRANGGGELESLRVSGSAVRIPHPHLVRVLSYGQDPQIYLPPFPRGKFDGPLRLEVWLKTETGFDSLRRGITDLALSTSRALEQNRLLEQTTRNSSNKDVEIETLQSQLEKMTRELSSTTSELVSRASALDETANELATTRANLSGLADQLAGQQEKAGALRELLGRARQTITAQKLEWEKLASLPLWQTAGHLWKLRRQPASKPGKRSSDDRSEDYGINEFWLERPKNESVEGATVLFAGWVFGPPGVHFGGVRAVVGGQTFIGQYGFDRPDVAAKFHERPESLRCGFSIDVMLAAGVYEVVLEVLVGEDDWLPFTTCRHEVLVLPPQKEASKLSEGQRAAG